LDKSITTRTSAARHSNWWLCEISYTSWGLSEEYGFTDPDGSRPNMGRFLKEHVPRLVNGKPSTAVEWKIVATW